jgi:DNA-binding XRE family transcriptional regulator
MINGVTKISPHTLRTAGEVLAEELAEDREFRAEWQRLAFARHVAVQLIRYRAENDLTQSELAKRLELSQPRIAKLESGEYNPRIETVIEITRKTGIEFAFDSAPADAQPKLLTKAGKDQVAEEFDGVVVRVASAAAPRRAAA